MCGQTVTALMPPSSRPTAYPVALRGKLVETSPSIIAPPLTGPSPDANMCFRRWRRR
jgi:hypothetical protein